MNERASTKAVAAVPPCSLGSVSNRGEKVVINVKHSGAQVQVKQEE